MDDLEQLQQQLSDQCVPCLGYRIKKTLVEGLGDSVAETVKKIPTCDDQLAIQFCEQISRGELPKAKRARRTSAYQVFMGTCLKERHKEGFDPGAMKTCAAQWREEKKNAER